MGCVSTKPEDNGGNNRKAGANSEEVFSLQVQNTILEIQEYGAEEGNQVSQ